MSCSHYVLRQHDRTLSLAQRVLVLSTKSRPLPLYYSLKFPPSPPCCYLSCAQVGDAVRLALCANLASYTSHGLSYLHMHQILEEDGATLSDQLSVSLNSCYSG